MASEIQFFWDQIHENNFVIRSFVILKSVNNINGDFSYNCRKGYQNSWNLDAIVGRWTLDARPWMLDSGLLNCFRTESEPSFWFYLKM